MAARKTAMRMYRDGGAMKLSKNLLESKSSSPTSKTMKKKGIKSYSRRGEISKTMTSKMKKMVSVKKTTDDGNLPILFNGKMRKTFVEGVLQDIKGMFEQKTDGKVAVTYVDHDIKNHEFGFRLTAEKTTKCSKQMWSEVTSAIVNLVNFMFPATDDHGYHDNVDIVICTDDNKLEVELVSNW